MFNKYNYVTSDVIICKEYINYKQIFSAYNIIANDCHLFNAAKFG